MVIRIMLSIFVLITTILKMIYENELFFTLLWYYSLFLCWFIILYT